MDSAPLRSQCCLLLSTAVSFRAAMLKLEKQKHNRFGREAAGKCVYLCALPHKLEHTQPAWIRAHTCASPSVKRGILLLLLLHLLTRDAPTSPKAADSSDTIRLSSGLREGARLFFVPKLARLPSALLPKRRKEAAPSPEFLTATNFSSGRNSHLAAPKSLLTLRKSPSQANSPTPHAGGALGATRGHAWAPGGGGSAPRTAPPAPSCAPFPPFKVFFQPFFNGVSPTRTP